MNKVIKYFLIIINIYCVCALIFYIKCQKREVFYLNNYYT